MLSYWMKNLQISWFVDILHLPLQNGSLAQPVTYLLDFFHVLPTADQCSTSDLRDDNLISADIAPVLLADLLYSHVLNLPSLVYRLLIS
jgi:hypothetical protein